jgi:hypothetical protein
MIFVFGSNLAGRHGKGAAKHALEYYGAVYGQGIGHHGDSYAIPTKDYDLSVLPLDIIKEYVDEFHDYAWSNSGLKFLLTPVGCGLAGYKQEEILPLFGKLPKNVQLSNEWLIKPKEEKMTQFHTFEGKVKWAKVYTPDEFRGAVRWGLQFYPKDKKELEALKATGIQKKFKSDEDGDFVNLSRSTTKLIKNKLVNFTPPIIYDKDGTTLVYYADDDGKIVRSYDDDGKSVRRVGEPVLIGNGSTVAVTISVYPTAMGPGNRLESVKVLDLIVYEKPETPEGAKEVKGKETEVTNDELTSPPW